MLLSFERPFVGAFAFEIPRAMLLRRSGLVQAILPESDGNMCKRTIGVPQELGRSGLVSSEIPGRRYRVTNSRPRRCTRPSRSEITRVPPRYRQAKATKCGEMDGWKSQHPHSTDEAGEPVPRDPVEGRKNRKGVSDVGTWAGNYVRGFVLGTTYHRNDPG